MMNLVPTNSEITAVMSSFPITALKIPLTKGIFAFSEKSFMITLIIHVIIMRM